MVSNCLRMAPPAQFKPMDSHTSMVLSGGKEQVADKQLLTTSTLVLEGLPVGLVLEIISHLHPLELLLLSRTNKAFRQLLLHRTSRYIWQDALSHFPVLPGCPPDLTEPQYARLAFEPVCHYCGERSDSDVLWALRVRACSQCLDGKDGGKAEGVFAEINHCDSWCKSMVPWSFGPKYRTRYCFVADLKAAEDALHRLQHEAKDKAELQILAEEWKSEEVKSRSTLGVHLMHCMYWSYELATEHYEELCANRRTTIEAKLVELGYMEEVAWMTNNAESPLPIAFRRHAAVRQPTPLSDHVWSTISDDVVEFADQLRHELLRCSHQ